MSVKGLTHQRLKDYCDARGISVSSYMEEIIAEKLDAAGFPIPTKLRPPEIKKSKKNPTEEIIRQHFTF